jgi:hypothetical protein
MENLLDCAPLPDQIWPGNKVLLSAAGGWATPTTGQQQFAYCTNDFDDALAVALSRRKGLFLQHPRLHQLRKPSSDAKHSP